MDNDTASGNDEDDLDGCDVTVTDDEATPDEHLPAAIGGVASADEADASAGRAGDTDERPDEALPTGEKGAD